MSEVEAIIEQEKAPKYVAIFKDVRGQVGYAQAATANALKKMIAEISPSELVAVWRGKQKEVKMKSVLSF